jgi:rod shape-determining protein MreD
MNLNTIKNGLLFVVLILLQVCILNHIHIGGVATPLPYIYFVLKLSSKSSRSSVILWSFALGLGIDIFNNTPGLNALATTVAGFLRYYVLTLFASREEDAFIPSAGTMRMGAFMRYAAMIVLLQHITLFGVEAFSFFSPWLLILKITCSAALTLVMLFALEAVTGVDTTRKK